MTENGKSITYDEALVATAIMELELVSHASSIDPGNEDAELMSQTALAVKSMEALVAAMFEEKIDQVHEDLGTLDPAIIQKAMQGIAMAHAQGR